MNEFHFEENFPFCFFGIRSPQTGTPLRNILGGPRDLSRADRLPERGPRVVPNWTPLIL